MIIKEKNKVLQVVNQNKKNRAQCLHKWLQQSCNCSILIISPSSSPYTYALNFYAPFFSTLCSFKKQLALKKGWRGSSSASLELRLKALRRLGDESFTERLLKKNWMSDDLNFAQGIFCACSVYSLGSYL